MVYVFTFFIPTWSRNKLHKLLPFKVLNCFKYNLKSSDSYIHSWNHHHNQDTEYFYQRQETPCSSAIHHSLPLLSS